jgi:iron-chelate-transporting ATPase
VARSAINGADLSVGYHGTAVIEGASIALRRGEVTALVGPNGSGKSTLLRALARLHRPDHGQVTLDDGSSAWQLSPKQFARRVTLLAQSHPTPTGICVRDVVGYGRHPYRGRWRTDDPDGPGAIAWAMEVTGLHQMADRAVDELSGGELQRVWLATCLAQKTGVLLLDEPTTFLDLRYQVEILDLVRELADHHDVAVGVVLHDLNQAAAIADQLVLLHDQRVRASGPPADVLTEDALTDTYGIRIEVVTDPLTRQLHTRPIGRYTDREFR